MKIVPLALKRLSFFVTCVALCQMAESAVVVVPLSGNASFQNQNAEVPAVEPGSGVDMRTHMVEISAINVGGNDYDLRFLFANSLGSSGIVERYIKMRSTDDSVELAFTAGPPDVVAGFEVGQLVDDSLNWFDSSSKDLTMARHLEILGSDTDQGEFRDGNERYAAFRFLDGVDNYYGYVQLTITDYPDQPTLSLAGYAYETTANTAILIVAVPEPAATGFLAGIALVAWQFGARRRRTRAG
jgi:hypothetical protein